jgi:hypothetical protein
LEIDYQQIPKGSGPKPSKYFEAKLVLSLRSKYSFDWHLPNMMLQVKLRLL